MYSRHDYREIEEFFQDQRVVLEIIRSLKTVESKIPIMKLSLLSYPNIPAKARPYLMACFLTEKEKVKRELLRVQHFFLSIAEMDVHLPELMDRLLSADSMGDFWAFIDSCEKIVAYVYDVLHASVIVGPVAIPVGEGGEEEE